MSGAETTDDGSDARTRIMAAAVRCVSREGLRGFSLEDVAAEAELSRTTLYRYFPGGRSQLVAETATWEIGRFWRRLAVETADAQSLQDRLASALVIGRRRMARSTILANLMDPEFEELIAAVQPSEPLIHGVIRDFMRELLEVEQQAGRLRESMTPALGADYLMRMTLSWMASPGADDLTDLDRAREIVRSRFLAGILRP